jgi:hypothetical protein
MLHLAAGIPPATLYENNGPIIELNRVTERKGWPAGGLDEKTTEFLLRLVSFSDLGLQQIGQRPHYKLRQRAPVVTPAPNRHSGHVEEPSTGRVAAEHDFEDKIMPAGREPALEAR